MRKGTEDADCATYLSTLNACGYEVLINKALMIFNKVVENDKIRPSQEHYGCLIDLLPPACCLSDTSGFISQLGIGSNAFGGLCLVASCVMVMWS